MEAERKLYEERAAGGANVIVVSINEEDEGGGDDGGIGGGNDDGFDIEEWRRTFPGCDDDGTRPDPHGRWHLYGGLAVPRKVGEPLSIQLDLSFSLCLSSSFSIGLN